MAVREMTGKKNRGGLTRMQRFAQRVERTLEVNESLPARRADQRIVTDLAELEVRADLLSKALKALVSGPRSKQADRSFQMRLISLVYEVTGMHDLSRELRGPLMRLVKEQCGKEEKTFELLTMAGSTIRGFAPPREPRVTTGSRGSRKKAVSRTRGRRLDG